jgi:hypothetical protein
MTMTFPLPTAEFWARLPVSEMTFDAPPVLQWSRTSGGQAWSAEIGDALFTGTVTLARMAERERRWIEPVLDVLRPGGRTFYAFDRRIQRGPAADPRGHVLGASTPTILSLPSAREMVITGLPARYQLTRGDYLAFDRPDGGRCLHLVVDEMIEASAAGVTPAFEVTPPIPSGAVTGVAVTLVAAACKAMIVPDSLVKATSRHTISDGCTFQFVQTLI